MELTYEERKSILDKAIAMTRIFCELKLAEDRLQMMSTLSSNLLRIGIDKEANERALKPYQEGYEAARCRFLSSLGIEEGNQDFWEWYKREDRDGEKNTEKKDLGE